MMALVTLYISRMPGASARVFVADDQNVAGFDLAMHRAGAGALCADRDIGATSFGP